MKTITGILSLLLLLNIPGSGQPNDLFTRLRAISGNGVDFYNVDGIEITSQSFNNEFSEKAILKQFKRYSIKESDLRSKDDSLPFNNYYISKMEETTPGLRQATSYYFIENRDKTWTAITFVLINKTDRPFEREFAELVCNKQIPKNIFSPLATDSIDFAGRALALNNSCKWMGINNVQCSGYGQMNWSVHKDLQDAQRAADGQLMINKALKGVRVAEEKEVAVLFEGKETSARKVTFDFTGIRSVMIRASGGKTLTVYYVAAPFAIISSVAY